ncbi:hypothetical protein [Morganella psychrotolerans]|uniref:Uncharacterized protein n=1 Tax=Morganella psychrotolerans TaxID=368603 RepID=A0A1B8H9W9_9GAMM|nr:hypothetical protein [Morganella psychrotolerans]OBU05873.1 hypothetical protein AYY17_05905 [Morganella psychrotolerans]
MKQLSVIEIDMVSGAGVYSDAGALIGRGVGTIVGHYRGTEQSADIGSQFGETIGTIVDQSVSLISSWAKASRK